VEVPALPPPLSFPQVLIDSALIEGVYVPPPYLDEYGESDPGLRRGNPMKLDVEKYNAIRKLWLTHGIPEEISRNSEKSTTVVTTEWQYL
jgi:E3 ubiquitin-protein ligase UBR2